MTLSWPLVLYVICGVLASGILVAQGATAAGGRDGGAQVGATVAALALGVAAAVFAALRLGRLDRLFNVFGNLTSGIAQGYLAVVVLIVAAVVAFFALRRAEVEGALPLWCAVVLIVAGLFGVYGIAANLTATSRSMAKTLLVAAYLLAVAAAGGSLVVAGMGALRREAAERPGAASAAAAVASALAGVLAVVTAAVAPGLGGHRAQVVSSQYGMVGVHPTDSLTAQAAGGVLTGEHAAIFWVVGVVLGAAVPLVVALATRGRRGTASGACAFVAAALAGVGAGAVVALALFTGSVTSLLALG